MGTIGVFGSARSGTSMTCGILSRIGVDVIHDESNKRQKRFNPTGAYEYFWLRSIGAAIENNLHLPQEELNALVHPLIDKHIVSRINSPMCGFKLPGLMCLPTFASKFDDLRVVAVIRNIVNQAKSFQNLRRANEGVTTPLLDLIEEMAKNNCCLLSELRKLPDLPVCFVSFQGLKYNTEYEIGLLSDFLGIEITEENRAAVISYIDAGMKTWQ